MRRNRPAFADARREQQGTKFMGPKDQNTKNKETKNQMQSPTLPLNWIGKQGLVEFLYSGTHPCWDDNGLTHSCPDARPLQVLSSGYIYNGVGHHLVNQGLPACQLNLQLCICTAVQKNGMVSRTLSLANLTGTSP